MVASILGQVTGQLEKRFLLNAFLPTLAFSMALGLAAAAGADGVAAAVDFWTKQEPLIQVLLVIGWVALVLVVANIVANGALWIIGVFEGYRGPARLIAPLGRNYHHWRAARVLEEDIAKDTDSFQERYPVYPRKLPRSEVAPTRLGNIIRSAETYPTDRYGADAIRTWPRLFPLLPESFRTAIGDARAALEFLLVVAMFASLYVLLAGVYLVLSAATTEWFLASVLGGTAIAFVTYFAALTPALVYGDHIRAAYDLHRFELLTSLRVPVPATLAEERRIWDQALRFLALGEHHVWRYVKTE